MVLLKEEKESLIHGLTGTTATEVFLISCVAPIVTLGCGSIWAQRTGQWWGPPPPSFPTVFPGIFVVILQEIVVFFLPLLLFQSHWLYTWGIAYLVGLAGISLLVVAPKDSFVILATTTTKEERRPTIHGEGPTAIGRDRHHDHTTNKNEPVEDIIPPPTTARNQNLTVYRSLLYYMTFVAILAVDFPSWFPLRLAKTETRGYSLMDLGAASFAISYGLSSSSSSSRRQRGGLTRRSLILIGLGVVRLLTHKNIEYQEHASEYGIHWNFNFTLAILPQLARILSLRQQPPHWILPTLLMLAYQVILQSSTSFFFPKSILCDRDNDYTTLQGWIERSPRVCHDGAGIDTNFSMFLINFWVANREGILGCLGYTSLFVISEWIRHNVLESSSSSSQKIWNLVKVWMGALGLWYMGVMGLLDYEVSRRSTNLPFCCWALVVNLPILIAAEFLSGAAAAPLLRPTPLSESLSRHGLSCFFIANLLTGAVNLAIPTIHVGSIAAFFVLLAYMTAIGTLAILLDFVDAVVSNKKPKPWKKD